MLDTVPAAARNNAIGISVEIWYCVECVNGEPWHPLDGISKMQDVPIVIDSETGEYINLVNDKDGARFVPIEDLPNEEDQENEKIRNYINSGQFSRFLMDLLADDDD